MKRLLFVAITVLALALVVGVLAQIQNRTDLDNKQFIILGGLKIKEGADIEEAERLLTDELTAKMSGVKGVKFRILKKANIDMGQIDDPGAKDSDEASFDYVMMAEVNNLQAFRHFMTKSYRGEKGLSGFGSAMKKYAGEPYINLYEVMAESKEVDESE